MRSTTLAFAAAAVLCLGACSGTTGDAGSAPRDGSSTVQSSPASSPPGASRTPAGSTKRSANSGEAELSSQVGATGHDGDIPKSCAISKRSVNLLVRDWGRVVGSVGRKDHAQYTGPFRDRVESLDGKAQGCPGSDHLTDLEKLAEQIDNHAADAYEVLSKYRAAVEAGNRWLDAMGFTSTRLPAG